MIANMKGLPVDHVDAVLLSTEATATRIHLPDTPQGQHQALRGYIGDTVERAYYHRQAVLHLHGESQINGMPPNFAAYALACAWRGVRLPYALCGPIVITGPEEGGALVSLDDQLTRHAEYAAETARTLYGQPVDRLLESVGAYSA